MIYAGIMAHENSVLFHLTKTKTKKHFSKACLIFILVIKAKTMILLS